MSVKSVTENQKYDIWLSLVDGENTKGELAKIYGVSTRTIGRVYDEINDLMNDQIDLHESYVDFDAVEDIEDDEESEEPTKTSYFFVAAEDAINITKIQDGSMAGTLGADPSHQLFDKVSAIIWDNKGSQEALEQAYNMLDTKTFIESYSDGLIEVNPEEGRVTYNNEGHTIDFSGKLVPRLIEALEQKDVNIDRFEGLVNFATRLIDNPSNRAVNELYDFLDAACIDINVHGDVLCYKKVSSNYHDIFSGTMDNSPGMTVSVPRNMVDEDSERTCSHGLHVCSSAYLPYYGWGDDCKVVLVAVDPADFVSIPKDYYGTDSMGRVKAKARVCKYEVLSDETDRFM